MKIYNSRMKYGKLIQRSDSEFKWLTGYACPFYEMQRVTTKAEDRKIKSGRPHTPSLAD